MRNLPADDCQSPDFIKLCSIMKDELDRIHTTLERNVVFDMLVEGCHAKIFSMDLLYFKTYRLLTISKFYFPRSIHDVHSLVPCFRRLDNFKTKILYRKPEDKVAQMKHAHMLAKCAIDALKLQPRTFNSLEVIEREMKRVCTFVWTKNYTCSHRSAPGESASLLKHVPKFKNQSFLTLSYCHYNLLQMLSLFAVILDVSFFPTLGHLCPKLKEL
ncbi:hypothetical protein AB4K20DRAFT_1860476 [Rhizopus microsporus]|uniref:Uncharacterized protein n=1 Tax=Rhizopus microsporus TaxID=58291 RepID=A0A1X0SEU1_RHIZD|nr:hypothetical protein BCV71DRAFT_252736 [Rhizopus microsporus]